MRGRQNVSIWLSMRQVSVPLTLARWPHGQARSCASPRAQSWLSSLLGKCCPGQGESNGPLLSPPTISRAALPVRKENMTHELWILSLVHGQVRKEGRAAQDRNSRLKSQGAKQSLMIPYPRSYLCVLRFPIGCHAMGTAGVSLEKKLHSL